MQICPIRPGGSSSPSGPITLTSLPGQGRPTERSRPTPGRWSSGGRQTATLPVSVLA